MEHTQVVIVGAGPSGLTMGLALARHGVKSVILEQLLQPDPDPRGVYLNGDAVRILWSLGLGEQHFAEFAGEPEAVHFYKTSITNPNGPYFIIRTDEDFLHQALPGGVTHVQPKMEAGIEQTASSSGYCKIRRGSTVLDHEILGDDRIVITYKDGDGVLKSISCSYLIGADGKRGVVRKLFLEPATSIRQIPNPMYQYEGTWIAANLQLTLPTPETHPDFPLWTLGYSPRAVYDLFCPKAWYFCSPPSKPTAGGRFGPMDQKMWRHEFAQPDWNDSMDAEELFWEHFRPFITRESDENGRLLACGAIAYPPDCIKVLRCRAFTFTHKVVNRWFDRKRILVGDAAHVFPPFGGQGIASGIRDAHQLAWRIALLQSLPHADETLVDRLLAQWARERRKSIDAATFQTKLNGQLCNEPESWAFYLFRSFKAVYDMLPLVRSLPNPVAEMDRRGFRNVEGGFFLPEYEGGGKFPQVFVKEHDGEIRRSDDILSRQSEFLKLLVLRPETASITTARRLLDKADLPKTLLADRMIIFSDDKIDETLPAGSTDQLLHLATPRADPGFDVRPGYQAEVMRDWLGPITVFALLRVDFHIFALMKDAIELEAALEKLRKMVATSSPIAKL